MSSPVQEIAAAWLAKQDRGLTPAEAAEFAQWAAHPEHAAAIAELETAWTALDELSALRPSDGPSRGPDPDLLRPAKKWVWQIYRWRSLAVSISAAAAAVIAFFFWNGTHHSKAEALVGDVFETPVGAERTVELADGSRLQLNTLSSVEVHFSASVREVILRQGEVFCTVTKDPSRPFVVKVGSVSVRAVGTAFDVLREPARTNILVTEGAVRLLTEGQTHSRGPALLEAGHRATLVRGEAKDDFVIAPIEPEESARLLAWREHQLEFKESSLAEVVRQFNRYNTQQLVIADAETAAVEIGGRFNPNNIEGFVRLLESSFHIAAERRDAHTVVLHRTP